MASTIFQRGATGIAIPAALHAENRIRVVAGLRLALKETDMLKSVPTVPSSSVPGKNIQRVALLIQGGEAPERYDTDHEPVFRQESYFQHLFGAREPGLWGSVVFEFDKDEKESSSSLLTEGPDGLGAGQDEEYYVPTVTSILFAPRLPAEYATWMGKIETPEAIAARYGVNRGFFVDEIAQVLTGAGIGGRLAEPDVKSLSASALLLLAGPNTDSGKSIDPPKGFPGRPAGWPFELVDTTLAFPVMQEARVIKTAMELDVLRYVNRISSQAHEAVMRRVARSFVGACHGADSLHRIGHEFQIEALFQFESYFHGGCRNVSYTCICASGENASTLHYGHAGAPNDRQIKDTELVLLDMGAEYHCYTSDITRSYPVDGSFTPKQRLIYETVLAAQDAVLAVLKPGVFWDDMHRLANQVICASLLAGGILQIPEGVATSTAAAELERLNIGAVFQPHGLGHLMGLDTHDVGGYPPTKGSGGYAVVPAEDSRPRSELPGLRSLRLGRKLKRNMVLTVEPGCYFIDHLLDEARANPDQSVWFNWELIDRDFRGSGGVRIEDDVIITENGCENMTTVPRTVAEIEKLMRVAIDTC